MAILGWSKPHGVYIVPGKILIRPDYDHRLEEKEGKGGGFELASDGKNKEIGSVEWYI